MRLPEPTDGVAFITGASTGIGRSLAIRLAASGWRVVVCARSAAGLDEVAATGGGRIIARPLDVTDEQAVNRAISDIEANIGPIALAVLNAGRHRTVRAATLSVADFRALIELNLMGTVHCLAALLPAMRRRKRGQIAITSSVAGYRGLPTASAYGMTKAGLINLAESLAPELEDDGIRVQIVNPGFVATPLTAGNPFPMPFLITPEAAAEAYYRGLKRGGFEVVFPWRMAVVTKIYRSLPYALAMPLARRLIPKGYHVER